MTNLPEVVLLGRMNVGKSTLFNRLSRKARALTLDYEGVTRDFIRDTISYAGYTFVLVDTGGVGLSVSDDPIMEQVRQRALERARQAALVLFVVDGTVGLTPQEHELARHLHHMGVSVVVVVTKFDVKSAQERVWEFERLGFGEPVCVSAIHNRGLDELRATIIARLDNAHGSAQVSTDEKICRVVLLGKPNVGKSSLLNKLLNQERTIVTDVAGTTREAITETVTFYQQAIELTDTAGVRKKSAVAGTLEEMMVGSSLQAVTDSNIVLLVVDASAGRLADQELKLAFWSFEHGKSLIILRNKYDLLDEQMRQEWRLHVDEYSFLFNKIEMLDISCVNGKNIGRILPLVHEVWQRCQATLTIGQITTLLKRALVERPLFKIGCKLAIFKAEQVRTCPPTFKVTVNVPQWFSESQKNFLDAAVRRELSLRSVPIRFIFCKRSK